MAEIVFFPLIGEITREGRMRSKVDDDKLFTLATSIQSRGLLHPIVVSGKALLAGENRMLAVASLHEMGIAIYYGTTLIPKGTIPAVQMGDLGELERAEVEWDENEQRDALTWQDRAKAEAFLHRLRGLQAAGRGDKPVTFAETAAEIQGKPEEDLHPMEVARVRDRIQLAAYLDDPAVAAAKTQAEAKAIIKKREQSASNLAAVAAFQQAPQSNAKLTLLNVDCLDYLRACPPASFEVVLTDPPYGINAQDFGDGKTNQSGEVHTYNDSPEYWGKLMGEFVPLVTKATTPNATALLFCDIDKFFQLRTLFQLQGWWVQRTPIIWDKTKSTRLPVPGRSFRRQYELILLAVKGEGTTSTSAPDVLSFAPDANVGHGAQKPVELYQFLAAAVQANNVRILDPFGGSCPALEIPNNYITVLEVNPEFYGIGLKRLERLTSQGDLL